MSTIRRRFGLATASVTVVTSLALTVPATAAPTTTSPFKAEQTVSRTVQKAAEQAKKTKKTKQQGTPPGRASDTTRALDVALATLVADGAIGVTARVEGPALDWAGAAGLRDKDGRAPAHRQDRFRAASNTKMMVATLVLQQVSKGTLALDSRVGDVMPELLPGHPEVTVRQLLSHTSGMPNGTNEVFMAYLDENSTNDDMLEVIGRDYTPRQLVDLAVAGQWTEPGQFSYSNGGYVALGMLLEHVTGRPVSAQLREHVWRPAGMKHTTLATEPRLQGPTLHEDAWLGEAEGWLELEGFDPDFFWTAGAVVTTSEDLERFTRALMSGKLVDRALLDEMMTPLSSTVMEYGLGLYRIADPCPSDPSNPYLYGHDGASFGTLSIAFSSPDGARQVTMGVTGRDLSSPVSRWDLNGALVPMLMATCPAQ